MADSNTPDRSSPKGRGRQGYTVSHKGSPGRNPVLIVAAVVAVVATVAIVVGFLALGNFGGGSSDFASAAKAGGCVVKDFPKDKGGSHLAAGDPTPKWDSDPPTHGTHDPIWAVWGIYDQPVDETKLVHNLEHAGLVVHFGPSAPRAEVDALRAAVLKDNKWIVMTPYPNLGDKISFAVWTHLAVCKTFEQGVLDHYKTYRNKPGGSAESDAAPNGRDWSQEERQPGY
jgi:hypothetical protein